jgi:hypothetical protein
MKVEMDSRRIVMGKPAMTNSNILEARESLVRRKCETLFTFWSKVNEKKARPALVQSNWSWISWSVRGLGRVGRRCSCQWRMWYQFVWMPGAQKARR